MNNAPRESNQVILWQPNVWQCGDDIAIQFVKFMGSSVFIVDEAIQRAKEQKQ